MLNVHPNTVRNRIKDGSIEAEKVVTERGPTWVIDPDSLTTNTPTSGSQQLVGRVPEEALTILAREIVKEAGLAQDPEREEEQRELDRIFEVGKHLSTLSATALVLIFATQGVEAVKVDVWVGMIIFGFALVEALYCMNIGTIVSRVGPERHDKVIKIGWIQAGIASVLFTIGLLFVVVLPALMAQA